MEEATLYRGPSTDEGTFGRLVCKGFACFTGELPWRENRQMVSCTTAGVYRSVWGFSPRFKRYTYRILGTPGRYGVLIHSANLMGDVEKGFRSQLNGCIALGEKLGTIEGQKALLLSRPAVRKFEAFLGRQAFTLRVVDAG